MVWSARRGQETAGVVRRRRRRRTLGLPGGGGTWSGRAHRARLQILDGHGQLGPVSRQPLAACHHRHRVADARRQLDEAEAERIRVVGLVAHAPALVDERSVWRGPRDEVRLDARAVGAPWHRALVLEVLDPPHRAAAQEGDEASREELEVVAVPDVAVAVDVLDAELLDGEGGAGAEVAVATRHAGLAGAGRGGGGRGEDPSGVS